MLVARFKAILNDVIPKLRDMYSRISDLFQKNVLLSDEDLKIVGLCCAGAGVVSWIIFRSLVSIAIGLVPYWNPGVGPSLGVFNSGLVAYAVVVLSVVAIIGVLWLCQTLPFLRRSLTMITERGSVILPVFSLLALLATSLWLARAYFAITIIIFLPQLKAFIKDRHAAMEQKHSSIISRLLPFMLFVPIIIACMLGAKAWYPVQIPNDYIELPDTITVPRVDGSSATFNRADIIDCLEFRERKVTAARLGTTTDWLLAKKFASTANAEIPGLQDKDKQDFKKVTEDFFRITDASQPDCKLDLSSLELSKLSDPIVKTGKWQSQAGRLLYHHSYVFVPAIHALRYGLSSPIPYLYGVGNTLFHAALMHVTSPSITGYFNTYPVAQLAGVLVIALLVFYITRSVYAVAAGCGLVLLALFNLGFEFVLLPPGFSPLRYAGLAVQVASIVCVFRGQSVLRRIGLVGALIFSFFWNAEYALIGLVGQGFALMSPYIRMGAAQRFFWLILSALVAAICMVANNGLSTGYLQPMSLGLFGLFPMLPDEYFVLFSVCVAFVTYLLVRSSKAFEPSERMARLCVLPVLALILIKFLFYALAVHLYYSLAFIVPVALGFINWTAPQTSSELLQHPGIRKTMAAGIVLLCLTSATTYYLDAKKFKETMVDSFEKHQWSKLGEHFSTMIPAEPIEARVEAVRSQVQPGDHVLLLSPFDHLLAFYVNPEHYCGHFELVVNPITYQLVQSVIDCARNTPSTLIVYDEAEVASCPDTWRANYYDASSCGYKKILKQNATTILHALEDEITPVKKIGSLTFYRKTH